MHNSSAILSETTVPLARINEHLPESVRQPGRRMNRATAFRWALSGRRSRSGALVKLEAVRIGHSWFSSVEALKRFIDALNEPPEGKSLEVRSPAERSKAATIAGRELEKSFGI
ncbi:MAG: DUF1580 domain-containing protein [Gemmataceae bacterium]